MHRNDDDRPAPPSERRRGRRRHGALSLLAVAGAAALAAGCTSSAAPSAKSSSSASSVKADLSYFKGKTIEFINGSSPGSGGDSLARPLAPYIQKYLGAAAVNVENITGSGSIAAQETVASAAPNGLTIGELTATSNYEGYIGASQAVNFNQTKETILGGVAASPGSCIFATPKAKDQTIMAFLKDPGNHQIGDIVPGTTDMEGRAVLWSYKVPASLVTGYSSQSGLAQGFARGDEPYAFSALTAFISDLQSGTAKCLLRMGVGSVPSDVDTATYLKGAPNLTQLVAEDPPSGTQAKAVMTELEALVATPAYDFFAPKGVAPGVALALQDAVRYAENQAAVKSQYLAQGNVPGYTPPATVISQLSAISAHISVLKKPVTSVG